MKSMGQEIKIQAVIKAMVSLLEKILGHEFFFHLVIYTKKDRQMRWRTFQSNADDDMLLVLKDARIALSASAEVNQIIQAVMEEED